MDGPAQLFRISRDAYLSAYPAALLPVLLLTVLLTFGSGAALLLVGRPPIGASWTG